MMHTNNLSVAVFVLLVASFKIEAFYPVIYTPSKAFASGARYLPDRSIELSLQKGWLDNEDDEDSLVTRDDFNRDMLGMEPKVKRKNRKGKGYKPLDNRDHLPFSVRKQTPDDPYKNRYQKKKEEQRRKGNKGSQSKKTDLDRQMLAATRREIQNSKKGNKDFTTPSKLVQRRSKKNNSGDKEHKSMMTVLGEFELDKSTTSGDVIVLGEKEYRVETARCQYKYAGGKRFVMVRKILEVKELTRVQTEENLLRQYNLSSSSTSTLFEEPEESE